MGISIFEKNNPYCMRYIKTNASGRYANIKLYDIFRKDLRLPDAKAQDLVQALNESVRDSQEDLLRDLATKEFVRENSLALKEDFNNFKNEMTSEFHSFKNEITGEIHSFKEEMTDKLHRVELNGEKTRTELTRSIFWSGLVQFLAIVGAAIGIISFMLHK